MMSSVSGMLKMQLLTNHLKGTKRKEDRSADGKKVKYAHRTTMYNSLHQVCGRMYTME